ncbi:hypothetical protein KUTeg_009520 [Tegillarca granosa]|uniref:Otopetrin n=1 Tax=Tegillarca granosa TaxID=220873 RepID=A0ABQ9F8E1_TEGGR|nr:hypothetical protein KUTeg_009520 [Tegillarca granosa]
MDFLVTSIFEKSISIIVGSSPSIGIPIYRAIPMSDVMQDETSSKRSVTSQRPTYFDLMVACAMLRYHHDSPRLALEDAFSCQTVNINECHQHAACSLGTWFLFFKMVASKKMAATLRNTMSDIVHSVVVMPLTAGNIVTRKGKKIPQKRFDGQISTSVFITWIIAIVFVIIITNCLMPENKIYPLILEIFMFVMEISLSIAIIAMTVAVCYCHAPWLLRKKIKEISLTLKVKFLWFFACGYVFSTINEIAEYANCEMTTSNETYDVNTSMSHSILKIIGILLQTGFISYFSQIKFQKSLGMHYGMFFIILSNLTNWGLNTVREYEEYFHFHLKYNITNNHLLPFIFQNNISCLQNSTFDKFFRSIHTNLFRLKSEYYLLSLGLLLAIWASTDTHGSKTERKKLQTDNNNIHSETDTYDNVAVITQPNDNSSNIAESNNNNNNASNSEDKKTELSPLLEHSGEWTSSLRIKSKSTQLFRRRIISFYSVILLGAFLYLPQLTGTLTPYFTEYSDNTSLRMWTIYKVLFSSFRFFLILLAFYKLHKECVPRTDVNCLYSNDYILLFGAFFVTVHNTLQIVAGASYLGNQIRSSLYLIHVTLDLLIDYFQTVLILQASRFKRVEKRDTFWPVECICLLLSMMNFGIWTVYSFQKDTFPSTDIIPKSVFSKSTWYSVDFMISPVSIFYMFHCFVDLFCLYKKFNF